MALQCGIVGLPNVGKSTLFNCLSNAKAQAANFPFCTIEPNVGVITVPDDRLNKLAGLVGPDRIVPTTVEIVDIAGLVKGASKGEGREAAHAGTGRRSDAVGCGVRHAVAGALPRGRSAGRYALHQFLSGLRGAGAACVRACRFHGLPGCRRPDPGQRRRACGGTSRA